MSDSITQILTKQLLDVMSSSGISSWIYDVKTGKRSNLQGENLLPESVTSIEEYEGFLHKDDIPLLKDLLQKVREGVVDENHHIVRFSTSEHRDLFRYYELFVIGLNDDDGKVTKLVCVSKDVNDLILNQQKLELADLKLRMVLNARGTVQYEFDIINDMVYPIDDPYFPNVKEIPAADYLKLFVPDGNQSEALNKMREGRDEIINTDYKIKEKNGEGWRYYSFTHVPVKKNSKGKVVLYEGLRYDNTIRARMTIALKESNLLFRTVIDRLPCLFFMKDVEDDYRYVMANDQFCDSLGKPREKVEGYTDFDMMTTIEEAAAFRRDDEDAIKYGLKSVKEITMWKGVKRVWHTTKSKMVSTSGKVYLIAMALEITSVEESMIKLQKAKEKAEEADKLKSAFLANMSHEIRTPLNSILGFSDLLVSCEDPVEKEQFGKIININGELLLHLVNEVLDLSKIEAGYLTLKPTTFDLSKVIEEAVATYSEKMKEGVKFICSNPYKQCLVQLDIDRINQVINNFVSNAIKYTVTGYIELGYKRVEGGIKIFVKDTGIGIKEEDKPKVFGRFNKLDDFAQGTGLGLSICKTLALSAGGDAGFESTKGVGSTFWIFIPTDVTIDDGYTYRKDKNMLTTTTSPETAKIKILVVEDNESNYDLLEAILRNYHVEKATNGLDAVKMAHENKYAIIFMDLMMPEMDGLEATRQIRMFDKEIPIVAITANIYAIDEGDARKAGCTAYIPKPIKKTTIVEMLEKFIRK